jgi:DNA (cytosine-5)-methyltransferase 1
MPRYPFEFHRGDAIEFVREHGHEFDFIAASPPCQASTALTKGTNATKFEYEQLIPQTRAALEATGKPYCMENVQQADMRRDLTLCGEMFGLKVIRHRWFETNFTIRQPDHIPHRGRVAGLRHGVWYEGPYFAVYGKGGGKGSVPQWQDAMGIDWTAKRKEIAEAIPPAYSEYIGREFLLTRG